MDFHEAWHWLNNHPLFTPHGIGGGGCACLDIEIVKVNPDNETIEDDEWQNTATRVWLEGGPWTDDMWGEMYDEKHEGWLGDYALNASGATFEEAFLNFVENVKNKYGDYGAYSSLKYGNSENTFWNTIVDEIKQ